MKNSLNIVLVALTLVVLGCSCQRLQEIAEQQKSNPSSTPSVSNTTASPYSTPTATTGGRSTGLTLDKYNQIKNGMTYREVVDIVGIEGTEVMSSGEGKYKVTSYQWKGENFEFLTIVLMGDKVTSKTQANLK